MTKIVLRSLNVLLGLFFIFLGVLKISPMISRDLHKDLRVEYAKYAKVFPLAQTFKLKLPSKWYRRVVGGTEIFSGFLLLMISNRHAKNFGNMLLMATKLLNLYSHYAINDQYERMAPSLVFFFMLVCRMVVDWQFSRQNKNLSEGGHPSLTGAPEQQQPGPEQLQQARHPTVTNSRQKKKNQ